MRLRFTSGFVLLLMLLLGTYACTDSSADEQAAQSGSAFNDDSEQGDLSDEALAQRAHDRAINHIRNSGQTQDEQNEQAAQAPPSNRQVNSLATDERDRSPQNNQQPVAKAKAVANSSSKYTVFVEHKLTDPGMNNAHSHTVLVPQDWEVQGGLIRPNIKLYNMPTVIDLKVTSSDGRQAHIFPALSCEFNNQSPAQPGSPTLNGNLYMPLPESAGRWLLQMAQQNPLPGVKDVELVSETMDEGLTAQLRKQAASLYQNAQQLNQMTATTTVGAIYDTQAQVITLKYTQDDQPFEETFLLCWYVNLTTIRGQVSSGLWGVTLMISVRDKPGKDPSKDPVLQTIFQSFRVEPAWQNEMNKYWAQLANIKAKGAADRSRQFAQHNEYMRKNNEEINNIIVNGYKNRQASSDRIQQRTVDTIQEVTPYHTPQGQTVRLPSFYSHAYTDGNGRYLLNNDANYNPNLDPTINNQSWQTIQKSE